MGLSQLYLSILIKLYLLMIQEVARSLVPGWEEGLLAEGIANSEVGLFYLLSYFLIFLRFILGHIAVSKVRMRIRLFREFYKV